MSHAPNRRQFLQTTAALAGATMPYWFTGTQSVASAFQNSSNRPRLGCIATGDRWQAVGPQALNFADCVAVCDVDRDHLEQGREKVKGIQGKKGFNGEVEMYEDYRKLLDRKDIDVVTIVTTDHWHSKIAIEAMQAGKDVYCEKPLTLTVHEGKQIIKVLKETKRVFQVGTQQRSEMGLNFLKAIAMVQEGRIGKLQKVTCNIGGAPKPTGSLPVVEVPKNLNWDMWLGQAPMTPYRQGGHGNNKKYPEARTHYEFRWWYEYSGGKMTDWGAHHVDIATWAMGMENSGPVSLEGTADHPVPFKDGWPTLDDRYNAATKFDINVMYPNGILMKIVSDSPEGNGILFEGTEGKFHVSRGKLTGEPAEQLASKPISEETLRKLYKGKKPGNHMANFFECIVDRTDPISDVYTHHRAMSTCHLANIAIRLGRKIQYDPVKEQIVGDAQAATFLAREQRKGYEINVTV